MLEDDNGLFWFRYSKDKFNQMVRGDDTIITYPIDLVFTGWSKSQLGTPDFQDLQLLSNLSQQENGMETLYATWNQPQEIVLLEPAKEGCVFLGWSLERKDAFPEDDYNTKEKVKTFRVGKIVGSTNGDDPIANVENFMLWTPKENTTLYAMWYEIPKVNIFLDDNQSNFIDITLNDNVNN